MNFKASILILATLKISSAKSIKKDQAAIIQCKIPDEKQFDTEKIFLSARSASSALRNDFSSFPASSASSALF